MRPRGANPRETNPKAAHPNSMREARLSCELPAESTGNAIMSLPKPSNQAPVIVTGASSGIGTELVGGLARRRYPLGLVARRLERLDDLAGELRTQSLVEVDVLPLDLSEA